MRFADETSPYINERKNLFVQPKFKAIDKHNGIPSAFLNSLVARQSEFNPTELCGVLSLEHVLPLR